MRRNEASTAFAVFAGAVFLLAVLGPVFLYAFGPGRHDREIALGGFLVLGLGLGAVLYGISVILREMGEPSAAAPAAPPADTAREELMRDTKPSGATPKELMSVIRTLIELENWKLAAQRSFELIEAFPQSEEAVKVKKNLEYLQKKAAG